MISLLKQKIKFGRLYIPNIRKAEILPSHRGLVKIKAEKCNDNCRLCLDVCPSKAITLNPLCIDMGKCVFCGDCQTTCPQSLIQFTPDYKISATDRKALLITSETNTDDFESLAIQTTESITKIFGRSLKLRQVSAGGCNACEMELNACSNINFDMGRFGIEFVASPRHADGIVITGPISSNMAQALQDAYDSTPDPKIIILTGSCAISGGVFSDSERLNRSFLEKHKIDLYIPGCPVHPLTFINGVLSFLKRP